MLKGARDFSPLLSCSIMCAPPVDFHMYKRAKEERRDRALKDRATSAEGTRHDFTHKAALPDLPSPPIDRCLLNASPFPEAKDGTPRPPLMPQSFQLLGDERQFWGRSRMSALESVPSMGKKEACVEGSWSQ